MRDVSVRVWAEESTSLQQLRQTSLRLERDAPRFSVLRVLGGDDNLWVSHNYKLAGFSVERLMNLLTALDQDVEIVIRKKPRSRKTARISVVAA